MFIQRVDRKHKKSPDFVVMKGYWDGITTRKKVVAYLGHHRTVELAHEAALRAYLRASDKLMQPLACMNR